jgi:MoxR-like ATPase
MTNLTFSDHGKIDLKSAITDAAGWPSYSANLGKTSGQLTKAEILAAAEAFGIDAGQYSIGAGYSRPVVAPVEAVEIETAAEAVEIETDDVETADAIAASIMAGTLVDINIGIEALAGRALAAEQNAADAGAQLVAAMAANIPTAAGSNVVAMPTPTAPVLPVARVIENKPRKAVFGISLEGHENGVDIWNAADAPKIDKSMIWDNTVLSVTLAAGRRGKNIWLMGPRGVGKTIFCNQLAAHTGRPFCRIGFHAEIEAVQLFGMTVPHASGGVVWQDGVLVAAMRRPGTVILLDETSLAPAGMLHALQTLLDEKKITLETGEIVEAAAGVVFLIADNTGGFGDATGEYHGTGPMNAAFLDRSSQIVPVGYLPKDKEVRLVEAKTGLNRAAAAYLVGFAQLTRQAGQDCSGLSPRRVFAWAEMIADGFPSAKAFELSVINATDPAHVETYRQLEKGDGVAGISHADVDRVARGEVLPQNPPVYGNAAADDFTAIDTDNEGTF